MLGKCSIPFILKVSQLFRLTLNSFYNQAAILAVLLPQPPPAHFQVPFSPEDVGSEEESSLVGGEWEFLECKPLSKQKLKKKKNGRNVAHTTMRGGADREKRKEETE